MSVQLIPPGDGTSERRFYVDYEKPVDPEEFDGGGVDLDPEDELELDGGEV